MANNRIKGLTVEIGGDTSKLSEALKDVDKRASDLSAELGDINRLLKLDPSNTELLAQKQKVLADAISNTSKRLDTLKEAERQAQAQFARGEISEEQYRALQREVLETERKLKGYEKAAEETADAINNLGKETKETEKSSGKLGEALGKAAKVGLAAVVGATSAAVAGLVGAAEATREYRTEMGKLETAFTTSGHSSETATKTYQALQGVLGETEQAVEAANHLAKLAKNEEDLATWTDIATGVYATFGASLPIEGLTEAANETAKTGALTGSLADALNWAGVSEEQFQKKLEKCKNEQQRQALITETLNGLYSEAADAYRETNAELIRANEANEAWTASLAGIGGVMEPIITDVKQMGAALLSDLVPGVQDLAKAFRGVLNGEEGATDALGAAFSNVITQLLDKVVELAPTLAEVALGLISTLAISLLEQLPTIVQTILQIVTSTIGTLATVLPQIVTAVVTVVPQIITALVNQVPALLEAAVTLLMAIVEALPTIIDALLDALPDLVGTIITVLLEAIPMLLEAAITLLMAIVEALPTIIESLIEALPAVIDTVVNTLLDNLPMILDAAVTFLMAIVQAIPQIITALTQNLPKIISTVGGSLTNNLPTILAAAGQMFLGIVKAIPKLITELAKSLPDIINAIVLGLAKGIGAVAEVGYNLVKGLWNGINDATGWVLDKIKGFGKSILNGIKNIFGVHSPSREMAWIGEMLDEGLAEGIENAADAPADAMADLSDDLLGEADALNGLTLERRLNHTFTDPNAVGAESLGAKLDAILSAIQAGQILTIDGKTFIGATADGYDTTLGQRRALAVRGAL